MNNMLPEDRLTLAYLQLHPLEAARQLETLSAHEAAMLLSPFPPEAIALVIEYCLPGPAAKILAGLPPQSAAKIIEFLSASSAIGVLRQLDESGQRDLLDRMAQAVSANFRRLMQYPAHTAGSLADPRVLTLPPDISVQEAVVRIKQDVRHAIYYMYVIDRDAKLEGVITLKHLMVTDRDQPVATLMTRQPVTVSADATVKEVLQHPQWARFHTLPVVDRWGTFLGALPYQTLLGVERTQVMTPPSGSLSEVLMQLWEAYSLAGISILTDMVQSLDASPKDHKPLLQKE
ncbi:MAG: magnesium transporter [Nitrospirae bacterium]|nr:MAG: magnesium transporter [Nitrospirota bacterium]